MTLSQDLPTRKEIYAKERPAVESARTGRHGVNEPRNPARYAVFCQRQGLSCTSQELPNPSYNISIQGEEVIVTSEQSNLDDKIPDQTPDHVDQRYVSSNASIRHSISTILHLTLPKPEIAALIFNR